MFFFLSRQAYRVGRSAKLDDSESDLRGGKAELHACWLKGGFPSQDISRHPKASRELSGDLRSSRELSGDLGSSRELSGALGPAGSPPPSDGAEQGAALLLSGRPYHQAGPRAECHRRGEADPFAGGLARALLCQRVLGLELQRLGAAVWVRDRVRLRVRFRLRARVRVRVRARARARARARVRARG